MVGFLSGQGGVHFMLALDEQAVRHTRTGFQPGFECQSGVCGCISPALFTEVGRGPVAPLASIVSAHVQVDPGRGPSSPPPPAIWQEVGPSLSAPRPFSAESPASALGN